MSTYDYYKKKVVSNCTHLTHIIGIMSKFSKPGFCNMINQEIPRCSSLGLEKGRGTRNFGIVNTSND